jgi:hypothetical protein
MFKGRSIVFIMCVASGSALADTDTSGYADEAANHASYVRSNAGGAIAQQMLLDDVYAAGVNTLKRTSSVDVQMTQCFSGGFLNDLSGVLNAATFRSAAASDEVSFSRELRNPLTDVLANVNDYTRASVEGRVRSVAPTMRGNFNVTRNGLPNLPPIPLAADPSAVVGAAAVIGKSHHQFWSPDPAIGPGVVTPNNDRTLFHSPAFAQPGQPAGPKQYAILVAWNSTDERHDVNLARQIDALTRIEKVPADNIVVLRGNAGGGVIAARPGITMNDMPGGLPAVRFDTSNALVNFADALRGNFFKVNGVVNANINNPLNRNIPAADDKLFIYNTGHGGHGTWNNQLQPDGTNRRQFVVTEGGVNVNAKAAVVNDDATAPSVVDADGLFSIQVTTSMPLDPTVFLEISGVNPLGGFAPLASSLLLDDSQVLDVTPLLELAGMTVASPLYTYQVSLPWQQIDNASGTGIDINFGNVFSQSVADSLLAINFSSGDQEYTHVFIPAPGALFALLSASVFVSCRRRQPRA